MTFTNIQGLNPAQLVDGLCSGLLNVNQVWATRPGNANMAKRSELLRCPRSGNAYDHNGKRVAFAIVPSKNHRRSLLHYSYID
jgi:hypothetical protein